MTDTPHRYTITEPVRVPWPGLILAYLATVPTVAGAIGVWLSSGDLRATTLRLTLLWAAAVVAFLSGVRRGLSFRAPDGATVPQIVTFLWLYFVAVLALMAAPHVAATAALLVGYLSLGIFDTMAARKEEAPPYFARLRPWQMSVPIVALLAILARQTFG